MIVNNAGVGNAGDYYELTFGLNYKPHANITIRPEMRYDWYEGNVASGSRPVQQRRQLQPGFRRRRRHPHLLVAPRCDHDCNCPRSPAPPRRRRSLFLEASGVRWASEPVAARRIASPGQSSLPIGRFLGANSPFFRKLSRPFPPAMQLGGNPDEQRRLGRLLSVVACHRLLARHVDGGRLFLGQTTPPYAVVAQSPGHFKGKKTGHFSERPQAASHSEPRAIPSRDRCHVHARRGYASTHRSMAVAPGLSR